MVTPTTLSPLVDDACHSDFCQTSERMLAELGFELTTTVLKPASQPTELPGLAYKDKTARSARYMESSLRRYIGLFVKSVL